VEPPRPAERAVAAPSAPEPQPQTPQPSVTAPPRAGSVTIQQVRDAWPEILETVQREKRSAWTVVYTSNPRALNDDVLTLSFVSRADVESFRRATPTGGGVSEVLRGAILEVLGIRVKFLPRIEAQQGGEPIEPVAEAEAEPAPVGPAPIPESERYGESVVREILGANFLEEQVLPQPQAPVAVQPMSGGGS
jgi:DNA polymerase-3 subunit gamma/tau